MQRNFNTTHLVIYTFSLSANTTPTLFSVVPCFAICFRSSGWFSYICFGKGVNGDVYLKIISSFEALSLKFGMAPKNSRVNSEHFVSMVHGAITFFVNVTLVGIVWKYSAVSPNHLCPIDVPNLLLYYFLRFIYDAGVKVSWIIPRARSLFVKSELSLLKENEGQSLIWCSESIVRCLLTPFLVTTGSKYIIIVE